MQRTTQALYEKLSAQKGDTTLVFYDFLLEKNHGDTLHLAVYHAFEQLSQKTPGSP